VAGDDGAASLFSSIKIRKDRFIISHL